MKLRQSLLWPLAVPYGAAAWMRAAAYEAGLLRGKRLNANVISVGNLTVGGTGKTPMVLWMAQRLREEGKKVGILTRGYRGGDGANRSASDEVQLLKERLGEQVAFGVGPDRYAHGSELAARGVDWFVLDDGFQHLQLKRDVDVLLVDATNPFGGGRLLPAGRMREPKTALGRADVIVITRSERTPAVEAAIRRDSDAPLFYAHTEFGDVRFVAVGGRAGEQVPLARDRKWFAFCGIGNPQAFLADLREWGFKTVGPRFFRDHHRYTQEEIDDLAREARAAGADGLICTEKDRFNLASVGSLPMETAYCQISLRVNRAEEFWGEVETLAAISRSKRL